MATRKRRRRRRNNKYRLNYKRLFIFFIFCVLLVFGIIYGISALLSHKKEYFEEGLKFYETKQYNEALEKFEAALSESQLLSERTDTNIKLYIADTYMKQGNYGEALTEYKEILENAHTNKKEVTSMMELADALYCFEQGNYTAAIEGLEKKAEKWHELYMYIGTCYGELENPDKMFENYEAYVKEFGFNSYIYAQYASYYISIEDYETAIGYINNGLDSDAEYNAQLRLMEIAYYEEQNDYNYAYELAEELVELYPDYEEGQHEYIFLSTRKTDD